MSNPMVQYVIIRGDLMKVLKWPLGAVIAQACHACTAVMTMYKDDNNVVEYTRDIDNMRKVVLEAKDEENLISLADTLQHNQVDFKLWIEQPENFTTCLILKPYQKDEVKHFFKNMKLLK